MNKATIAVSILMLWSAAAPPAQASLIKKAAKLAIVVGAGAAVAAKAKQATAPAATPEQSAPAAATPSTQAPVSTAEVPPKSAKPNANTVIDKTAAKVKTATAAAKGWFVKKKAELETKRAEQLQPVGPTALPSAGGQPVPGR